MLPILCLAILIATPTAILILSLFSLLLVIGLPIIVLLLLLPILVLIVVFHFAAHLSLVFLIWVPAADGGEHINDASDSVNILGVALYLDIFDIQIVLNIAYVDDHIVD